MTGRRLLRIILGLVAANVVDAAFGFAFVLLFQFPDQVGMPSRAQQWFYGFAAWQSGRISFWYRWRWVLGPHISGAVFPSSYGSISSGGLLTLIGERVMLPVTCICA
jgi:hypothetical protein